MAELDRDEPTQTREPVALIIRGNDEPPAISSPQRADDADGRLPGPLRGGLPDSDNASDPQPTGLGDELAVRRPRANPAGGARLPYCDGADDGGRDQRGA